MSTDTNALLASADAYLSAARAVSAPAVAPEVVESVPPLDDAAYRKIMADLGMPESRSLHQALLHVANWSAQRALSLHSADASGGGGVLAEVAAKRRRQIEAEGWTPEHDDHHGRGEMAAAAAAYAYMATLTEDVRDTHKGAIWGRARGWFSVVCAMWPWAPQWFKPTDPRRDLIKAAALIVAEIERLDRSAPPAQQEG